MKRLFLILTLFFGFQTITNGSQSTQDLKGDEVFPLRDRAYSPQEVQEGLFRILHQDNKDLVSKILKLFFRRDFPKTPFTIQQEIKCWQCFYNTLRGNLCASNLPTTNDSKETQLNGIANFLGHHKTGRTGELAKLYPNIFNNVSEDFPHTITNIEALLSALTEITTKPDDGDILRSSS